MSQTSINVFLKLNCIKKHVFVGEIISEQGFAKRIRQNYQIVIIFKSERTVSNYNYKFINTATIG